MVIFQFVTELIKLHYTMVHGIFYPCTKKALEMYIESRISLKAYTERLHPSVIG